MAALTKASNLGYLTLKWCLSLILLVIVSTVEAGVNLKPFESTSLASIEQTRQGEAFVMVLWSIECPPCLKELKLLSRLKDANLLKRLVLVSTDGEDYRAELEALIKSEQVADYENWLFNDPLPERLRYNIDPSWYGELPRAYFYNAEGQRYAHSGILTEAALVAWLAQETSSPK